MTIEQVFAELRERITALETYPQPGGRDSGLAMADLQAEAVEAFKAHVLDLIDEVAGIPTPRPLLGAWDSRHD